MSNLTALEYLQENSQATPGLWNQRYSVISANFAALNSDITLSLPTDSGDTFSVLSHLTVGGRVSVKEHLHIGTVPSEATAAGMTIGVRSDTSDYLYFVDSSAAKSNYVIGSRNRPSWTGIDGLSIWDTSADTLIANFSKQSIRFFQNVVGPVFDTGGALADTYNAATFVGSGSTISGIQAAINQASIDGVSRVYLPSSMYPYSASSISFVHTVQMVREGGNWNTFDVLAYGAFANGVQSDTSAIQAAVEGASAAGGGVVLVPPSTNTYALTSHITLRSGVYIVGESSTTLFATYSFGTIRPALIYGTGITVAGVIGIGIDGNRSQNTGEPVSGFFGNGIMLDGAADCIIRNNRVVNTPNSGIASWGNGTRVYVTENFVDSPGRAGITMEWRSSGNSRPVDCVISSNYVRDAVARAGNVDAAIWLSAALRCKLVNNSVVSSNRHGIVITLGDQGPDIRDNLIAGNTVFSTSSTALVVEGDSGTTVNRCYHNKFIGNSYVSGVIAIAAVELRSGTVRNSFVGESIVSSAGYGVEILTGADGNTFDGCQAVTCLRQGFVVNGGDFNTFANCLAEANTEGGLQIGNGALNTVWVGGRLSGFSAGDSRQSHGFVVTSSAVSTVVGNVFVGYTVNESVDEGGQSFIYGVSGSTRFYAFRGFAGTAVNPSMRFTSEDSLGWYRSAASTMALSYGTLRVNGAISGSEISISPGGKGQVAFDHSANANAINLYNSAGNNTYSAINKQFTFADNSFQAQIRLVRKATGGNYGSSIAFLTEADAASQSLATRFELNGTIPSFSSGVSIGNSGTLIPAISSTSSLVAAFVVQGSASSFTVITWAAAQPADQILVTVQNSGAVSSLSSGLVLHSHCTQAGQVELRLSNVSTLVQNQSSRTYFLTRISPF